MRKAARAAFLILRRRDASALRLDRLQFLRCRGARRCLDEREAQFVALADDAHDAALGELAAIGFGCEMCGPTFEVAR